MYGNSAPSAPSDAYNSRFDPTPQSSNYPSAYPTQQQGSQFDQGYPVAQQTQEYVPVAQGFHYPSNGPVFQDFKAVNIPQNYGPCAISPQLWGIMEYSESFSVRQHAKFLPKACCVCPPCVKQENSYSIYAGMNRDAQAEILRVDEVIDDWNRCCCVYMYIHIVIF
jgi:hypothetical protein